jgi:hypothetical protein
MLRPDKLKSPDCVGHEPSLVRRPEGSTLKVQSPKTTPLGSEEEEEEEGDEVAELANSPRRVDCVAACSLDRDTSNEFKRLSDTYLKTCFVKMDFLFSPDPRKFRSSNVSNFMSLKPVS